MADKPTNGGSATIAPREAPSDLPAWLAIDGSRLKLRSGPELFESEPERLLVTASWAARLDLSVHKSGVRSARRHLGAILQVPRSRWHAGFGEMLMGTRPSHGLRFLQAAHVLPLMLPEVSAMVDFHRGCLPVHHKDIWDHTLQVVDKCPPRLSVRWAALMHDAGKVWTRTVRGGKVQFFRHEELGAVLMQAAARRFEMPAGLRDRVVYIIAHHARANVYSTEWTDTAVRRLIRDFGEHLEDVIAFSQSDYTTKRADRIREVEQLAVELNARIARIIAEDAKPPPLPKGVGNVVMTRTGRRGGPWLGELQRWLVKQVEDGAIAHGLAPEAYVDHAEALAPELLSTDATRPQS